MTAVAGRTDGITMVEQREPRFVQFGDGEMVDGLLHAIQQAEVNGKPATRFVVLGGEVVHGKFIPDGEACAFLGTYQIETKLRTDHVGHFIQVRCEGEDASVTRNGRAMKKFYVAVSKENLRKAEKAAAAAPPAALGITDDDIPF